jgi:hypothetical protein
MVFVVCVAGMTSRASAATITVGAGESFQAALDSAQPGDTIVLQAGATFTGPFILPVKAGATYITVKSSAADSSLPARGTRTGPGYANALPKIVSNNTAPALIGYLGAHHFRFENVEIASSYAGRSDTNYNLVFFGTDGGGASHIGIYVGEGRFVHAPSSGGTVRLDLLDTEYWRRAYVGARRLL